VQVRVTRTESDGFLHRRDGDIWLGQKHRDEAKLKKSTYVIAVESNHPLKLDPRFGQPVLGSEEYPHHPVRQWVIHIAIEGFEEQLFGEPPIFFV
jgi:hypothetical protein